MSHVELTPDDRAELRRIVARLGDQDNAYTKEPMFCVQKAIRHQGIDANLAADEDEIEWVRHGEACPESWRAALNAAYENGDDTVTLDGESYDMSEFERYGFKDDYETVMIALTREGCEKYLSNDGHNLRSKYGAPRIYVESFYRCEEMIALRRMLPVLSAAMDELDDAREEISALKCGLCSALNAADRKDMLRDIAVKLNEGRADRNEAEVERLRSIIARIPGPLAEV